MRIRKLFATLIIVSVVLMSGCKKDEYQAKVGICPVVVSTIPADKAVGVPLNQVISATFNEKMDPATFTSESFKIQGTAIIAGTKAASVVSGAFTFNDNTVIFTPSSPLTANTTYIGTVKTTVKDLTGNALQVEYIWSFATGVPPAVTSADPANNSLGVSLNKVVVANFNMPMDPLTLTSTTFTLKQGSNSIAGVVTKTGSAASFDPTADLLPSTVYTATITTGAANVAGLSIATDYVWTFTTQAVSTFSPLVDLKTAGDFGILAYTTVTNNAGPSVINNMDVGISPGVRSSVTGFPPATIVNGAIYAADDLAPAGTPARLTQAKLDLTAAYLFAEGATAPAPATVAGDQGGKTLAPGIYKSTSTLMVQNGDLTLDGQGDPNATWIFQISSDFTTVGGAGGSIILTGSAQAKNIFWQVGNSAVIGDNTKFNGNVLALTSITMNSGATAVGRMLAQNGAVVMTNANTITKP